MEGARWALRAPTITFGLSQLQRLLLIIGAYALAAVYLKRVVANRPPGWLRALLVVPLVVLNWFTPVLFEIDQECLLRTLALLSTSFLGTFKVLGFAMDRGALVSHGRYSTMQVLALLLLPVYPQEEPSQGDVKRGRAHEHVPICKLMLNFLVSNATLVAFIWLLLDVPLPTVIRHVVHVFMLYQFVNLVMTTGGVIATGLFGITIIPPFDKPHLSTSVADWWGRRWNITISAALRTLIYDTICEGHLVREGPQASTLHTNGKGVAAAGAAAATAAEHAAVASSGASSGNDGLAAEDRGAAARGASRPPPAVPPTRAPGASHLRRSLGLLAVFFASGVVHEVVVWSMHPDGKYGWKMTLFFTIQAPLMMVEQQVKHWWRRSGRPPLNPWLSRLLTLALMELLAAGTFIAVLEEEPGRSRNEVLLRDVLSTYAWLASGLVCLLQASGAKALHGVNLTWGT